VGVSLVAAGIDLAAARDGLSVPARAQRFGLPYARGLGERQPAPDGQDSVRAFRTRAVAVLPIRPGQSLQLRGWVRSPEGDTHVRIWSDNQLIFNVTLRDGETLASGVQPPAGARAIRLAFSASRGEVLLRATLGETAAR
jgi:hypothetical protein